MNKATTDKEITRVNIKSNTEMKNQTYPIIIKNIQRLKNRDHQVKQLGICG